MFTPLGYGGRGSSLGGLVQLRYLEPSACHDFDLSVDEVGHFPGRLRSEQPVPVGTRNASD